MISIARKKLSAACLQYDLPKKLIGELAGVNQSNVSVYVQEGGLSTPMETKISDAIRDVVMVMERCGAVRPDVYNTETVRKLIENANSNSVYVVLLGTDNDLQFFAGQYQGKIYRTRFMLQAMGLSKETAESLTETLRTEYKFQRAETLLNPYGRIDERRDIADEVLQPEVPKPEPKVPVPAQTAYSLRFNDGTYFTGRNSNGVIARTNNFLQAAKVTEDIGIELSRRLTGLRFQDVRLIENKFGSPDSVVNSISVVLARRQMKSVTVDPNDAIFDEVRQNYLVFWKCPQCLFRSNQRFASISGVVRGRCKKGCLDVQLVFHDSV